MAHNMTSSDEASGWNPASNSDGEPRSTPVGPSDVLMDWKDDEIEPLTVPAHTTVTENAEASADSNVQESDTLENSQEQAAHSATDTDGGTLNADQGSSTTARPEAPIENRAETPDGNDDKRSQGLPAPESMEMGTDANNPSDGGEDVKPSPDQLFPEQSTFSPGEGDKAEISNPFDNIAAEHDNEGDKEHGNANGVVDGDKHGFWSEEPGDNVDADEGEDFFSQLKTQTKPIYVPPETDTRFEEGVPLLDEDHETPAATTKPESQIDQIFNDDEDEADSFFSEVQKSTTAQDQPSHLARKSTSQVIDSVGGAQDSPNDEASPSSGQFNTLTVPADSQKEVRKASSEDDLAARWQEVLDDDDMFLEDEAGEDPTPDQPRMPQSSDVPVTDSAGLSRSFETPESGTQPQTQPTPFASHQPSASQLPQGASLQDSQRANAVPAPSYFAPSPRPDYSASRAESFAERSKEGYKSPYDIPMDLTRPRRPVGTQKPIVAQPGNAPAAPPRSSSIPTPPPTSSMSMGPVPPPAAVPPQKNFYEELPMSPPKPRAASSGRYTPDANAPKPGFTMPPPPPINQYTNVPPPPQGAAQSYGEPQQQQQPERLDAYGNMLAPNPPSVPNASSRYSPKPPGLQAGTKPPPSSRYSPAPPPASGPPRNRYASQPQAAPGQGGNLPFQPRTSSPLAYHEKASYLPQSTGEHPPLEPPANASPTDRLHPRQSVDQGSQAPRSIDVNTGNFASDIRDSAPTLGNQKLQASPPRSTYAPPAYVNEFSKRLAPVTSSPSTFPAAPPPNSPPPRVGDSQPAPPRRSQTQSPGKQQMRAPNLSMQSVESFQRPASAHDPSSPVKDVSPYAPSQVSARNRSASQHLHFIPPNDEQQLDPLERWKGAPIVVFGFGGVVTSCFPRHIPRYIAGQAAPMIKSSPGEVKISQITDWMPAADVIVQHPGPLKAKSKKKDLLAWLSGKIAAFENEGLPEATQLHPDSHKRQDERILLWKVVRILVENDGALEGSENLQSSLRSVILPGFQTPETVQAYGGGFTGVSNLDQASAPSRPDAADPHFMENLRNDLAMGDREKAVWGAVDNRLWGHAMVLASTLDKSVWKQVVQEFVRREVRSTTGNTESLAALYEIFAGNTEESIDELVPPSARAGLQMISKGSGPEPVKNALDGLDRWRETLGLVLSNRSPEDHHALLALGRLLSSYGRTEAAHICYMFSRVPVFGGPDDPQANIVLLGADHQHFPATFFHDEDAILLTDAYEYAISVLAGASTATLPHLLAFKLIYAKLLADRGRNMEALQYCDSIAATLRATTRPSGYHHQLLFSEVGELSARLRQTTGDGGSSWISKPSMEKVSGSMWARFNSFVSGEDSDAASTGSGKGGDADVGPFAKVSGTPTVSRSPSVSDFYGSYPGTGAQPIPANGPSRYHPANQYAPNSSPEQFRGRSSFDSQRPFGAGFGPRRNSQEVSPMADNGMYQGGPFYNPPSTFGYQSTPPQSSHMPLAPVEEDMTSSAQTASPYAPVQAPSVDGMPYQPPMDDSHPFGGPLHRQDPITMSRVDDTGYVPPTSSYEPPVNEAFAISTPESKHDLAGEVSHTKDGEDEDDSDIAARSAAIQKEEKQRKDREADEAFRKAAEEDGKLPWCGLTDQSLTLLCSE